MNKIVKLAVLPVVASVALVLGTVGTASAAAADNGPAIAYWPSAVPVLNSTLSNSSNTPDFPVKDGWTLSNAYGICSAYAQLNGSTVWSYSGTSSDTTVNGKVQWTANSNSFNDGDQIYVSATDCLGNSTSSYAYADPTLTQQGAADYSAGWKIGDCSCWSGGSVEESTKAGQTASYDVQYSSLVTLIMDKGKGRGTAEIYLNGKAEKSINFAASTNTNRLLVWNSPYLNQDDSYTLTVKSTAGRVDLDAFLTEAQY